MAQNNAAVHWCGMCRESNNQIDTINCTTSCCTRLSDKWEQRGKRHNKRRQSYESYDEPDQHPTLYQSLQATEQQFVPYPQHGPITLDHFMTLNDLPKHSVTLWYRDDTSGVQPVYRVLSHADPLLPVHRLTTSSETKGPEQDEEQHRRLDDAGAATLGLDIRRLWPVFAREPLLYMMKQTWEERKEVRFPVLVDGVTKLIRSYPILQDHRSKKRSIVVMAVMLIGPYQPRFDQWQLTPPRPPTQAMATQTTMTTTAHRRRTPGINTL